METRTHPQTVSAAHQLGNSGRPFASAATMSKLQGIKPTGSALDQQRSGAPATTSQLNGNEREHRGLLAHLSSGVDEQRLALRYLIELQAARAMQRCIKGRRMTQSKQEHRIHLPWLSAKDKLESRCCKSSRRGYSMILMQVADYLPELMTDPNRRGREEACSHCA